MKRVINLLTVLVMVSVNVFTPFSYAEVETGAVVDIEEPIIQIPVENNDNFISGNILAVEEPLESNELIEQELLTPVFGSGYVETMSGLNTDFDVENGVIDLSGTNNMLGITGNIEIYDEMLSGSDLNILDEKLLSGLDLDKNELEIMDNSEMYTITFDTNGATSKESITLTGGTKLIELVGTGYSYTSNISEDGTKNDNYGNYWGDDHIVNKVVTITGANILEVTIRYGGESDRYDWACVWEGNHSDYSASNKYDLSISGKLGGGKSSDAGNTKTYKIKGDTVTFGFTSDVSDCGTDGYGYYAIVNGFVDRLGSNPERDFSNFEGWYLDDDTKFDYENYVLESDLNLHAKYKCNLGYIDYGDSCGKDETIYSATIIGDDDDRNDFEYGIIAISDGTDGFVIMDRNLGARSKWDGVTWTAETNSEYESDSDSYGYYYQWGNNWGFSTKTTTIGSNTEIVVDDEFIPSKYSSGVRNSAWPWTSQTNLRGGDSSMEVVKKGPCPEGWHVPSTNEWQSLVSLWCKYNKGNTSCSDGEGLARDLLLPPAGARKYNSVSYDNKGVYGDYLACTAYSNGAYRMGFGKTVIVSNQNGNKSIGFPVRCFRNSQDKIIVTYHTNGGRLEYDYGELEKGEKLNNVPIPTRENYRFMGWFTDENFNEPFDPSADITGSFDLYADWRCGIGTTETEDGLCIRDVTEYSVVLEGNGGSNMNNFKYKKIDLGDYVIMDRDLGATKIGNAGYYYQWGNNYGFEGKWPSSTSNPAVILSSQIPSKYSSGLRNTNNPWTTEINMWGDLSGTDVARQGPCPEGWHVPSNEDWNRLYDEWSNSQNKSTYYQFFWKNFVSDLNFVYNGTIEGGGSSYTSSYNYYPYIAEYWTSSHPSGLSNANVFYVADAMHIGSSSPTYGHPVRCFENAPIYNVVFHPNSGVISEPEVQQLERRKFKNLPIPTTGNIHYQFGGWYDNENFSGDRMSDFYVTGNIDLYAKWDYYEIYSVNAYVEDSVLQYDILEGSNLLKKLPTTLPNGYIVAGWFLDSNYTQQYDVMQPVTGNLDLYAKGFEYGTLTFENPDDPLYSGIIMMDRNLGALESGTGQAAYGYYYQWGNNYGFPNTGKIDEVNVKGIWDFDKYNNKGYYDTGFYKSTDIYRNDGVFYSGLRGGQSDNIGNNWGFDIIKLTSGYRQGPCPEGWHVPSAGEWSKLMEYRKKDQTQSVSLSKQDNLNYFYLNDNNLKRKFLDDLKMPFAGYRYYGNSFYGQGAGVAEYRSSTPYFSDYYKGSRIFQTYESAGFYSYSVSNRYYGYPVRCFKNEYNPIFNVVNFETNGGYDFNSVKVVSGKTLNLKDVPINLGYNFEGWYTDLELTIPYDFSSPVRSNITLYAKWNNKFGTISISDPDNINNGFTIMDANLGALKSGIGKESYGYLYQRGNNHGFLNNGGYINTTTTLPDWNSGYDNKGYYGTQFVVIYNGKSDYWKDNQLHDGLRGGSGDGVANNRGLDNLALTLSGRQGPCPNGYHVPSAGEWSKLLKYWVDTYSKESGENIQLYSGDNLHYIWTGKDKFQEYFMLPLAGVYQLYSNPPGVYAYPGNPGGYYWSSSISSNNARLMYIDISNGNSLASNYVYPRYYGESIRCFKNKYESSGVNTVKFDANGGYPEVDDIYIRNNHKLFSIPLNLNRENSKFEGWYTDSSFNNYFDITQPINSNLQLFAKWSCDLGFGMSDDGQSCEKISVNFRANGGKFSGSDVNIIDSVILKRYEKMVKYSHTSNVTDDGVRIFDYGISWQDDKNVVNKVVSIPGSERLDIKIRHGGENCCDYVAMWTGSHPEYKASSNYNNPKSILGTEGKLILGVGNSIVTDEYSVDGDTVTFSFYSDGSVCGNGYGYYATIQGTGDVFFVGYGSGVFDDIPVPIRDGYTFMGWYFDNGTFEHEFNPYEVLTGKSMDVYAMWKDDEIVNYNEVSNNYSGGGKKIILSSQEHGVSIIEQRKIIGIDNNGESSERNVSNIDVLYGLKYTQEQNDAYSFAKSIGITTTSTIKDAKMNTNITRIEMAKMLSYYAINVLGQQPDTEKGIIKFNDVTNKMDKQYDNGVTLAYQLGIMGQNVKNNEFRPNDEVTRAEIVTSLSRMLYGTPEGTNKGTSKYYEPHMAKLYNEGIITNTDPNLKEKRGYVMTMLMRSVSK